MICDSHTHVKIDDIGFLEQDEIYSMVCAMNPVEAKSLIEKTKDSKFIHTTCAIHPNESDKYTFNDIFPYLKLVKVIGEIGMDNVWCKVDFAIQRSVFIEHLNYAQESGKPVIIHCKGLEKATAEILENYKVDKIIHWYSCFDYLPLYLNMDCYFTIGPSILKDEACVVELVKRVPLNRIMVETDGIEGVNWALDKDLSIKETKNTLISMIKKISEIKEEPLELVQNNIEKNFFKFF